MLLNLRQFRGNAHGLKNFTEVQRWGSTPCSRASTAVAVKSNISHASSSSGIYRDAKDGKNKKRKGTSTQEKSNGKGVNVRNERSSKNSINARRNHGLKAITSHNPLLFSIERFIASRPSNSQLDSFIHRRLSSPQYLQQYTHAASRAALLEQLVQLLLSKRCYVQAAGVYNRMRDWEGYVPASGRSGGEGWKTEVMMLGMALAMSEKTLADPATEIDQTISTLSIIFRHTLSDNLLLALVHLLSELGTENALIERVIWVYIGCREQTSSHSEPYIPPLSMVSLLAGILTKQGKVREALEFVERCDDLNGTDSQYLHIMARSHPYNTIVASLSSFTAHESTEVIDLVLTIMASRDIPSDRSLINILLRDQADRAGGRRTSSSLSSSADTSADSDQTPTSIVDDASEIGQIWNSISGNSEGTEIDHRKRGKLRKKEQKQAFEKAFTLYGTLCQAHDAQESRGVIPTVFVGTGNEIESYKPSFRPDFFTFRTLWDLLVRRPGWRFSSSPLPTSDITDARKANEDIIEDEYGFDLTIGSDEFDGDEFPSDESSDVDDNASPPVAPVLPPRKLFHDMMRYHFSHLINIPTSLQKPKQHKQSDPSIGDALDVKATAQSQFLLNTALLTFLNRSPSCGGADYAAAMVVLKCFRVHLDRSMESSPSSMGLALMETQEEIEGKGSVDLVAEGGTTTAELTSLPQIPQIPVPLRTYRILLRHLLQSVTSDLRLALRQGTGKGSYWARWVLSIGAGDFRQFRWLLSSAPPRQMRADQEHHGVGKKVNTNKTKRPTEKIIGRILKISSIPVLNETPLDPSSLQHSTEPRASAINPHHDCFHRDFYYFNKRDPLISVVSSTSSALSALSALYVPTCAQISRTVPLPSLMYYYPDDEPSRSHGVKGIQNKRSLHNYLKTRSLNPVPLEIMIKRAWVASNYSNYTDYPDSPNHLEYLREDAKETEEQDGEYDGETRRLERLLRIFGMEVDKAWKEMIPSVIQKRETCVLDGDIVHRSTDCVHARC
ncbi:hypothetical protein F5876DRAFT_67331 [Lentinula aff. lateritia]|uniref:Uncharacterized protein n=1 Tax=Lentinula aff. lateritia TaxID=2804960 RepID=A0ACC1TUV8_9AGAR|nr:hypothetical protein F5876DRAFT_67331 [Lentinula aff. lateritia]